MSKDQIETRTETQEAGYAAFEHTFYDKFAGRDVSFAFRFRRPTQPQVERAQKTMMKKPGMAFMNLALDVVHPDQREELRKACDTYPGLGTALGNAVLTSVGFGDVGN
ncbi:hypothetical protein V6C53_19140 [Desulfocurvibacter africanus]|uniref:DUF6848 family protein n=1 Tax=Desulfocurvibacter africanus TaxID=873 RepID=UPI002FDAAF94